MIEDIFLLRGNDYAVNDFMTVKHPTLNEIMEFGESKYYQLINPFVLSSEDLMVEYDDIGVDYSEVDNYETFLNLLKGYINQNIDFSWLINFSLSEKEILITTGINDDPVILKKGENRGKIIIDRLIYHEISYFLKKINNIPFENKYNPANTATRKFLIKEARKKIEREKKKKKDTDSHLRKIISALCWKNSCGINLTNVWDLHLYQVFDGILSLNKIDKANHLIQGIYSGVVDSKKINSDDLSWFS
jgi:hypothetical protein